MGLFSETLISCVGPRLKKLWKSRFFNKITALVRALARIVQ